MMPHVKGHGKEYLEITIHSIFKFSAEICRKLNNPKSVEGHDTNVALLGISSKIQYKYTIQKKKKIILQNQYIEAGLH